MGNESFLLQWRHKDLAIPPYSECQDTIDNFYLPENIDDLSNRKATGEHIRQNSYNFDLKICIIKYLEKLLVFLNPATSERRIKTSDQHQEGDQQWPDH